MSAHTASSSSSESFRGMPSGGGCDGRHPQLGQGGPQLGLPRPAAEDRRDAGGHQAPPASSGGEVAGEQHGGAGPRCGRDTGISQVEGERDRLGDDPAGGLRVLVTGRPGRTEQAAPGGVERAGPGGDAAGERLGTPRRHRPAGRTRHLVAQPGGPGGVTRGPGRLGRREEPLRAPTGIRRDAGRPLEPGRGHGGGASAARRPPRPARARRPAPRRARRRRRRGAGHARRCDPVAGPRRRRHGAAAAAPALRLGVDRRPDQRVPGSDVVAVEVDEGGRLGPAERGRRRRPARAPHRPRGWPTPPASAVSATTSCTSAPSSPASLGEHLDQPARQRDRVVEGQPRQRVGPPHELGDGERVAGRDDSRAGRGLGGGREAQRGHERPDRGGVEPGDRQLGQAGLGERPALARPDGGHDEHRVGAEPPRREGQGPRRRLVEQVGVVEQHDERAVLGPPGEHRERRGPDREGRGRVAVTQGEGHAQGPAWGAGSWSSWSVTSPSTRPSAAYGTSCSAWVPTTRTTAPAASAATSSSSVDLPTPASPVTTRAPPRRKRAPASSSVTRRSSASRPTTMDEV